MTTSTIYIKDYVVKMTNVPNQKTQWHCTCPQFENSRSREVPCKHILAILFTGHDTDKWEKIRESFSREFNMPTSKAECIVAKGLRNLDPAVISWYTKYLNNLAKIPTGTFQM